MLPTLKNEEIGSRSFFVVVTSYQLLVRYNHYKNKTYKKQSNTRLFYELTCQTDLVLVLRTCNSSFRSWGSFFKMYYYSFTNERPVGCCIEFKHPTIPPETFTRFSNESILISLWSIYLYNLHERSIIASVVNFFFRYEKVRGKVLPQVNFTFKKQRTNMRYYNIIISTKGLPDLRLAFQNKSRYFTCLGVSGTLPNHVSRSLNPMDVRSLVWRLIEQPVQFLVSVYGKNYIEFAVIAKVHLFAAQISCFLFQISQFDNKNLQKSTQRQRSISSILGCFFITWYPCDFYTDMYMYACVLTHVKPATALISHKLCSCITEVLYYFLYRTLKLSSSVRRQNSQFIIEYLRISPSGLIEKAYIHPYIDLICCSPVGLVLRIDRMRTHFAVAQQEVK